MEPEINQAESRFAPLKKVTPFSKYLALGLFIALPFIGGWIGYMYAPEKDVEADRIVFRDETSMPEKSVSVLSTPEVEFVRNIDVSGTITGQYRDINNIQILSTGELAYEKSDFSKIKDTYIIEDRDVTSQFYVGNTEIFQKDSLTPIKEIGGKHTYLIDSGPYSLLTLMFGEEKKSHDSYFLKFEDVGGKLAYIYHKRDEQFETLVYDDKVVTTADIYFTLLKDVGGKLAYAKKFKEGSTFTETLFYDGKEIKTAGQPVDIEMVSGKIAYIVRDDTKNIDTLFYDGKQVDSMESIRGLANINEQLVYQRQDGKNFPELVVDGKRIIVPGKIQLVTSVGGKLAYTFLGATPDKQTIQSVLVLDEARVAFATSTIGWARFIGDMIMDVQDVGGKLAYTVEGTESEDSFYYDEKKVLTAEIIGNSYQTIEDGEGSYTPRVTKSSPFYFYGANEKNGITTFSIYRIIPE